MSSKHKQFPATVAPLSTTASVVATPPAQADAYTWSSGEIFYCGLGILCVVLFVVAHILHAIEDTHEKAVAAARSNFPKFLRTDDAAEWLTYRGDHAFRRSDIGDARLAYMSEIAKAGGFCDAGIPLGQALNQGALGTPDEWTSWLRYDQQAHIITIAPARSGKFRDVIAPALLSPLGIGSCIVIDPKGQAAATTRSASEALGACVNLNPYDVHAGLLASPTGYNPMRSLDPLSPGFGTDCNTMADAIIWTTGNDREDFFNGSAADLISAGIYYFRKYGAPEDQNLVSVREMVSNPSLFQDIVKDAIATGDEILIEKLSQYEGITEERRSLHDVLATARKQTSFIGSDTAIRKSLRGNDASPFDFRQLRRNRNMRVFLILPGDKLAAGSKWFRLVVASALRELMQDIRGETVTMILDEAAALGKLSILETAMGLSSGYKIRCWPIFQDLNQIRSTYGNDAYETFLANSGVQQFFAPRDMFTAEYLSKKCGVETIEIQTVSTSSSNNVNSMPGAGSSSSSSVSVNSSIQSRPILYPHDILKVPRHNQLIFMDGVPGVIRAGRWPYWKIRGLEGRADPDPYHDPANDKLERLNAVDAALELTCPAP